MASRKDYVSMAETIRVINAELDAEASRTSEYVVTYCAGSRAVLYRMACALSDQYKRDNDAFDRGRFAFACGFDETLTRNLSAR